MSSRSARDDSAVGLKSFPITVDRVGAHGDAGHGPILKEAAFFIPINSRRQLLKRLREFISTGRIAEPMPSARDIGSRRHVVGPSMVRGAVGETAKLPSAWTVVVPMATPVQVAPK